MPKTQAFRYTAYPAVIPYPLLSFVGSALKWFIILLCAASIPFTLYRCMSVIKQVAHPLKTVQGKIVSRQHAPSIQKGQRP